MVVADLPLAVRSGASHRVRVLTRALGLAADVHLHSICKRSVDGPPPWAGVVGWSTSSSPALGPVRPVGSDTAWVRNPHGHPSDDWLDPSAVADLRQTIGGYGPDVIVLAGFATNPYLEVVLESGAVVVLDHQNVEADLADEIAALDDAAPRVMMRRVAAQRTAVREAAVVAAVDRVWAVSSLDAQRLVARYRMSTPVDVVPNVVDRLPADPLAPSRRRAPMVLFPASYGFAPNVDAARWLLDRFLPELSMDITGVSLVLAGSDPPAELIERRIPGASVTGSVADLGPLFGSATLMPVPLRAGSGTRIKILEGLAHRVPVMTTAKGCAGLDVEDGVHLVVEDDLDNWSRRAVALHRYTSEADLMTQAGRLLVEQKYSMEALSLAVATGLERCLS